MNNDPGSLSNLQDIVLPDPVPLWPPGSGGLLVLAALVLCVAVIALHYYLKGRRNRYRRAGLVLLAEARTCRDVSVVLKRVALAAFPREQVASLYGGAWVDFLNQTCPRSEFQPHCFSDPDQPPPAGIRESARRWISGHRIIAATAESRG
jgi:hypothetical protein